MNRLAHWLPALILVIATGRLPSCQGQEVEDLKNSHSQIMAQLNPILTDKVFPNLTGSTTNINLKSEDISVMANAMELAALIQQTLSPSEVRAQAESYSATESRSSRYVLRKNYRWVWRRGLCGRCYRTCVCCYQWIRVETSQTEQYSRSMDRQPLRDAIEQLLEYFEGRKRGEIPSNAEADRIAVHQAHSIMLIVDPEFAPGRIVE